MLWSAFPDRVLVTRLLRMLRDPRIEVRAGAAVALRRMVLSSIALGFEVAIETNGTKPVPEGVDWVCVSPKAGAPLVVEGGDELKLVYPQAGAPPENFVHLSFTHRYLQPMDGPARESNTAAASDYCLRHPAWRLSLQTHKLIGIR